MSNFSEYDIKKLNSDQKVAFNMLCKGDNVFISGQAGTGKSYLLNCFLKYMHSNKKNVIVTAPSGIAALNIGGVTLHSAFQIPIKPLFPGEHPDNIPKIFTDNRLLIDAIVIDEISMCRCDIFEYISQIIRTTEYVHNHKIQVVVVGDFYQIPPVISKDERNVTTIINGIEQNIDFFKYYYNTESGFAFQSPSWKLFNFSVYQLTKVIRQSDTAFINHLNKVRVGDYDSAQWIFNNSSKDVVSGITLCPTNKLASQINKVKLDQLNTIAVTFEAEEQGKVPPQYKVNDDKVTLKVGAEVMILVNNRSDGYFNGSLGKIRSFIKNDGEYDGAVVELKSGKVVTVLRHDWEVGEYKIDDSNNEMPKLEKSITGVYNQIPLKLAYAATIHKSQGQTFDAANVYPECFAHGQLYVALSRVKSIDSLHIMNPIQPRYLLIDNAVENAFPTTIVEQKMKYTSIDVPIELEQKVRQLIKDYEDSV